LAQTEKINIAQIDLKLLRVDRLAALAEVRKLDPQIVAIIHYWTGTIETDVEAMKAGAFEFIAKLSTPDQILKIIDKSLTCLKKSRCQRNRFCAVCSI